MTDKREFSYLPIESFNYISKDIFKKLVYNIGDNQIEHSKNVNILVKEVLMLAKQYLKSLETKGSDY